MLTWDSIQSNAVAFSKRWKDGHNEEAEAQSFTTDFLHVFGVDDPVGRGDFEYKVPLSGNKTGYIDYLWKSQIAIEMKSRGKDLEAAFEQLRNYMTHLPEDDVPDLWMVCDFENIRLSRRSTNEFYDFKTKDLRKHIKKFANIAGYITERKHEEQIEVNAKAAEKMAKLHDALKASGYDGHELEIYLVRLLFCLFADDTGIFPQDSLFYYIENSKPDGSDLSHRLADLFEILNMPDDVRAKRTLLSDELKQFRYVNGKLFSDRLPPADFDGKMRQTFIDCINFDWNKISPAIFGAMFQGVMDAKQRRELGAHYTSEENILKLINPLFLDELWKEFDRVKTDPAALDRFHEKIAGLRFLDPACGCGNFLIITYRELRLLELEILKMKGHTGQLTIDITPMLKVNVGQFYGIEIEDFPCQIAQVGMWLMDHQMNQRASEQFGQYYARLPLRQSATIVHGNALRLDWESQSLELRAKNLGNGSTFPASTKLSEPGFKFSYIMGNPPFKGFKFATREQKDDMQIVFGEVCKTALLDYVGAWYKKAAEYIQETKTEVAFVSTNSIVQGTQAGQLWGILIDKYNVYINFAHRTFKWSNEAKGKAAVHCVIIGFSMTNRTNKLLVEYEDVSGEGTHLYVDKINPYLLNADNIVVTSRAKPLCDVPEIFMGNQAMDGGNLIVEVEDYEEFISKEPLAKKYIKKYMMGYEFINNEPRYCLWLKDCPPSDLRKMPYVMERVNNVRKMRASSNDAGARRLSESPTLFRELRNPDRFIAIPITSSETRRYIPIGYLDKDIIAGNTLFIIENVALYHFGILTSNVHMAWMRTVGARLKSDYRYSKDIVYNNFPWPETTEEKIIEIGKLAQAILDARANHPESSLADLYDPLAMPPDLLNAHRNLDRAVMKLYGFSVKDTTEAACVAALMERYQALTTS